MSHSLTTVCKQAMEDYKPLTNEDLKSWELCDSYTEVSKAFRHFIVLRRDLVGDLKTLLS